MPNSGHCNASDIFLFTGNFGDDEKALKKGGGEKTEKSKPMYSYYLTHKFIACGKKLLLQCSM